MKLLCVVLAVVAIVSAPATSEGLTLANVAFAASVTLLVLCLGKLSLSRTR